MGPGSFLQCLRVEQESRATPMLDIVDLLYTQQHRHMIVAADMITESAPLCQGESITQGKPTVPRHLTMQVSEPHKRSGHSSTGTQNSKPLNSDKATVQRYSHILSHPLWHNHRIPTVTGCRYPTFIGSGGSTLSTKNVPGPQIVT